MVNTALDTMIEAAEEEPQRAKGLWLDGKVKNINNGEIRVIRNCSECGSGYFIYDSFNSTDEIPKFCPNCGADMRGEEE
jgi:rubrerythrin